MEAGEFEERQRIVLVGLGVLRCADGVIITVVALKEMEHACGAAYTPFVG